MKEYDIVIGLEIHVQLKTESKMFCSTSARYFGENPNSHICPTCLGLPGALPVTNKKAMENAIKVGLALNCRINYFNRFDRKSYFYPDLPKGFQISQFDLPVAKDGFVMVEGKKVRVNRAHQEEDTGKLIHQTINGEKVSLIDFNRSGVPLIEIVSEPDISSAIEAKNYAKKIHQLMRYIAVADVDMEKAGMRFDANVSIKPKGSDTFGTKVEIKNINSFNFLEKAINFEVERQVKALENGEKIVQETRGWVESRGETVSQRTKETSPDYRYFPDPDLPPLNFTKEEVEKLKEGLPELPDAKITRFQNDFGLSDQEAKLLAEDRAVADWFELALDVYLKQENSERKEKAKKITNWVQGEVMRVMNETNSSISNLKIEPANLVQLLLLIDEDKVSHQAAKQVFSQMLKTGEMPEKIVNDLGLGQISNQEELEKIIDEIIVENPKALADYKEGKKSSLDFLFGQVMRKAKGANPTKLRELLFEKLK
jgi:aspartyl-tRNA(Asn)/glutamyl-tRNA(Gln) amidotransferase subunit B